MKIAFIRMSVLILLFGWAVASAEDASPVKSGYDLKLAVSRCAQCHLRPFKSVDTAVKTGKIKPGEPEKSSLYERIKGSHMNLATGLSDADLKGVYDSIKNLKASDFKMPGEGEKVSKPNSEPPPPEPPDPVVKFDRVRTLFNRSFSYLDVPTGFIIPDSEETLLRYQACDLARQIAFLEGVAKLELSKGQAGKLLPFAREARDLSEERATMLRDQWRGFALQCNWVRKERVVGMCSGGSRLRKEILGTGSDCGNPAYFIGRKDMVGEFYCRMAKLGSDAESAALTDEQKGKLALIRAEFKWIMLPLHTRSWVLKNLSPIPARGRVGGLGYLLMAPNAVAWLEKKAGQDPTASLTRAKELVPLGAELIGRHREMMAYDIRLVDGANIITGFNFTEKQLTNLISILQCDMKDLQAAHAEANKKSLRPLVALLAEMRDDVEQGKGLAEDKEMKVVELQRDICRGNYRSAAPAGVMEYDMGSVFCPIHKEYTAKLDAIFKRLDGDILDEAQCKLLFDSQECSWCTPAYMNDPIRVGQVSRPIDYPELKVLARLRSLDAAAYPGERDAFADKVVKGLPRKGAEETQRVVALLDRIRDMSDATYQMDRFNLLAELLKRGCPETTGPHYGVITEADTEKLTWDQMANRLPGQWSPWDIIKGMKKAGKPMPSYLEKRIPFNIGWAMFLQEMPSHYLMDPLVVPSLETMLTIVRSPGKSGAVNLDNMPKTAETVENYLDSPATK